jgi:hypothetical protein
MSEFENEYDFEENISIWSRIRWFIMGKDSPDIFTKITFYIIFVLWSIFFVWNILSLGAISFRDTIEQEKQIPVTEIINLRGRELGFSSDVFLNRLMIFHWVSIICWLSVFISIILLWRKNKKFVFFFFSGTMTYFVFMIYYLSLSYYTQDTTFFDKIAFIALNLAAIIYSLTNRANQHENSNGFFGD